MTEAEKRAIKKYRQDKSKTYAIYIQFYQNTEKPLIEKIKSQSNKSGYVKGLIRKDIDEEKTNGKNQ